MRGASVTIVTRARTLGVSAALILGSLGIVVPSTAAAAAPTTWDVQAGNADDLQKPAQEITVFYPVNVTVHPGDQIKFTPVFGHTVTFNPPPIYPRFAFGGPLPFNGDTLTAANQDGGKPLNSGAFAAPAEPGRPPAPASYTLKIAADAAGGTGRTFHYRCMFHLDMSGSITAVPAAQELPSTNAENVRAAKRDMKADLQLGKEIAENAGDAAEDKENEVVAGVGTSSVRKNGGVSVLRFLPGPVKGGVSVPGKIEINVGQTIKVRNLDRFAPHTFTIGPEKSFNESLVPYGTPNDVHDPNQQVNSGALVSTDLLVDTFGPNWQKSPALPPGFKQTMEASFTFTKPGVYNYICIFHDEVGMIGQVIVEAEGD